LGRRSNGQGHGRESRVIWGRRVVWHGRLDWPKAHAFRFLDVVEAQSRRNRTTSILNSNRLGVAPSRSARSSRRAKRNLDAQPPAIGRRMPTRCCGRRPLSQNKADIRKVAEAIISMADIFQILKRRAVESRGIVATNKGRCSAKIAVAATYGQHSIRRTPVPSLGSRKIPSDDVPRRCLVPTSLKASRKVNIVGASPRRAHSSTKRCRLGAFSAASRM